MIKLTNKECVNPGAVDTMQLEKVEENYVIAIELRSGKNITIRWDVKEKAEECYKEILNRLEEKE